jgi:hypothetical protein
MKLMSLTTVKLSVIGALVVACLAVPTWQQIRLQRAQSANVQLRAQDTALHAREVIQRTQATELAALRSEVQRLRKVADDHTELEQLREWKAQAQSELIRLREMPGVARRADLEEEQLRAQLARQASAGGTNSYTAKMMDGLKKAFAQRVEGDLAGLTARLHLTPKQVQAVRDILTRNARARLVEEEQRVTGKSDKDEVERLKKEAGNRDEQIKALLTEDQKAAWPDYKQEVAAKDARWIASTEMNRFQSELNLTSEQADQAFAALYQFHLDLRTGKAKSDAKDDLGDFMWQLDQQTKALEPILTLTQLESLRQSQDSLAKSTRDFYSKTQGTNGSK